MPYKKVYKKEEKKELKTDFPIVGWTSWNKKGTILVVFINDDEYLGFIRPETMQKLLSGEVQGCPIKKAKD